MVSVTGAHLHTAGACRFDPAPVAHTAVHVVSSAVVRCEVPRRELGNGALTLVAETPAAVAVAAAAVAVAEIVDNGSVGLILAARQPATVSPNPTPQIVMILTP